MALSSFRNLFQSNGALHMKEGLLTKEGTTMKMSSRVNW